MTPTRDALERLLNSAPYALWAADHPVDARKVAFERGGTRRPTAASSYARAIIDLLRLHPRAAEPPPVADPMEFWRSQGFYQSWGLQSGWTPAEMVRRAKDRGAEWIAVQDLTANRARKNEIKAECVSQGVGLAVWHWSGSIEKSKTAIEFWSPNAWIENVEHFDWEAGLPTAMRSFRPKMPMALITNFSGCGAERDGTYNALKAKPWIDADFALHVESYMVNEQGAQPTLHPDNLVWTAMAHLLWPQSRIFPTFALYRTKPEYFELWRHVWPNKKPGMEFYAGEATKYPFHSWYLLENL